MFQQRHFEALAKMMQETYPQDCAQEASQLDSPELAQWYATRNAMVNLFARSNPNFMVGRFETACMPGANVRARGTQRARGSGFSATSHGR